jgi:hypothetical protein
VLGWRIITTSHLSNCHDDIFTTSHLSNCNDDIFTTSHLSNCHDDIFTTSHLSNCNDDIFTTSHLSNCNDDIFTPTRPVPTVQHRFSPYNGRTGRCLSPRRHTPGARDDNRKLSKHKQILLNAAKSAILFPIRVFLTASYGGLHNSPSKKYRAIYAPELQSSNIH